jgi:hypothetical protein
MTCGLLNDWDEFDNLSSNFSDFPAGGRAAPTGWLSRAAWRYYISKVSALVTNAVGKGGIAMCAKNDTIPSTWCNYFDFRGGATRFLRLRRFKTQRFAFSGTSPEKGTGSA